jgi:hypothetical protein
MGGGGGGGQGQIGRRKEWNDGRAGLCVYRCSSADGAAAACGTLTEALMVLTLILGESL